MQSGSRKALPPTRSEATRAALVRVALDRFGAKGFEATSTREIASAASANIASIAYHFGGKDGLRIACADFVVATMSAVVGLAEGAEKDAGSLSPVEAQAALRRIGEGLVDAIVARDEARSLVRFVLREMFEPSPAFEQLDRAIRPIHARACRLWARATGAAPDSDATKLAVFSLIGQVLYFRLARPEVMRILNWAEIGPSQADAIKSRIAFNLDAAVDRSRRASP